MSHISLSVKRYELNILNENVSSQYGKLEAAHKAESMLAVSRYSCQHSWEAAKEVLTLQKDVVHPLTKTSF